MPEITMSKYENVREERLDLRQGVEIFLNFIIFLKKSIFFEDEKSF
jgi:hypothetical protein